MVCGPLYHLVDLMKKLFMEKLRFWEEEGYPCFKMKGILLCLHLYPLLNIRRH